MSNMRVVFHGLRTEDYIHPDEDKFRSTHLDMLSPIQKGFDLLNDASVALLRQITEGKWVELKPKTAPKLFEITGDVCRILDFQHVPHIFTRHERSMRISVGGTDYMQMLIPDYILNEYDLDMQYYAIGNAISMFKSNHVQIATICSVICDNVALAPIQLAMQAYLRAADLTSDRGGLLACQDFPAALRCLLMEGGLPLSELKRMGEGEIVKIAQGYVEEMHSLEMDLASDAAALWKRITRSETPPFKRTKELLDWHDGGYQELLNRFRGGVIRP